MDLDHYMPADIARKDHPKLLYLTSRLKPFKSLTYLAGDVGSSLLVASVESCFH